MKTASIDIENLKEHKSLAVSILSRFTSYQKEESIPHPKKINPRAAYRLMLLLGYTEGMEEVMGKVEDLERHSRPLADYGDFLEAESDRNTAAIDEENEFDEDQEPIKTYFNLRPQQFLFRQAVFDRYGVYCAVCGIPVMELLEAAHIISKSARGKDDPRNGVVLCCLHHKAFDSGLFAIEPDTLRICMKPGGPSAEDLRIRYHDLNHLHKKPHPSVLKWRWDKWLRRN
jgi:hypothetical protein